MALPYSGAAEGPLCPFVWALPWLPWADLVRIIHSRGEKLVNLQILHHHIAPTLPQASLLRHQRLENGLHKNTHPLC